MSGTSPNLLPDLELGEYDRCAIYVMIHDRPFSPLKKAERNDGLCHHAKLH